MTTHPNRGALPRPSIMLREIGKRYPNAWSQIDEFRRDRDALGGWPEWCYCPMAGAYAVVHAAATPGQEQFALDGHLPLISDVQAIPALSAWRVSQGIYRFDPTLAAAIRTTPITTIPVEVLYRLPEWCVYIEDAHESGCGFFAHLEWDANASRPELRLLQPIPDRAPMAMPLHLDQPTLDLAVEAVVAESRRQLVRMGQTHRAATMAPDAPDVVGNLAESITPLLNLVLYLCSANADWPGPDRPERPRPTRTKRGWKLFAPDKPRIWEMGARIGAALRAAHLAKQTEQPGEILDSGRSRPVPHIRRAHWHTYRIGPGRADATMKWLPPIPVNIDQGDFAPTIHPVKYGK